MTQNATPKSGWQILAKRDLLIHAGYSGQVQTWMVESMRALRLDPELLNRMLKSARLAISRTESTNLKEPVNPAVHLRLYLPLDVPLESDVKRNWGFLRIDQLIGSPPGSKQAHHLIEFYLYPDSQDFYD